MFCVFAYCVSGRRKLYVTGSLSVCQFSQFEQCASLNLAEIVEDIRGMILYIYDMYRNLRRCIKCSRSVLHIVAWLCMNIRISLITQ